MELPESSRWHPLRAARLYEKLAEEAAGLAQMAFTEYGRLKREHRLKNPRRGEASAAYLFSQGDAAKSAASDVATYTSRAVMLSSMAAMKYQRYLADRELSRSKDAMTDPS